MLSTVGNGGGGEGLNSVHLKASRCVGGVRWKSIVNEIYPLHALVEMFSRLETVGKQTLSLSM